MLKLPRTLSPGFWFWLTWLPLSISAIMLVILNLHNLQTFPYTRGFDAMAHIEYIDYVRSGHLFPPLPHAAWEFHQPPLYYWLGAILPSFGAIKLLGLGLWVSLGATLYWFFRREQFSTWLAGFASLLCAALPLSLYLHLTISNEFFVTVLISLTLAYYLQVFLPAIQSTTHQSKTSLILGLGLTLCLLAKATAVLLPLALAGERLWFYRGDLQHTYLALRRPLMVAAGLAGWFYLRNFLLYGQILVDPLDWIPLRDYAQPIIARDLGFLTDLSGFLTGDLFYAHYYSLIPGTYFSWFYDAHTVLVPVQPFSKAGVMIVWLSLPFTALALGGLLPGDRPLTATYRTFILYTVLLLGGYWAYNVHLPLYSTVKAVFISSLILPFGYFVGRSWQKLSWQPQILASWYLVGWVLIVVRHFWVQSWWY